MLQNAYLLAKIGADTAENERKFAENLPKIGNYWSMPVTRHAVGGLPAALLDEQACSKPAFGLGPHTDQGVK